MRLQQHDLFFRGESLALAIDSFVRAMGLLTGSGLVWGHWSYISWNSLSKELFTLQPVQALVSTYAMPCS